ncbi:hypothetical protein IE53DRAFT_387006 [Violaceomyces palustris]|uniref:Uncharacterized protein n=1 Tax=Violaceomyces palustris TaxID=1673888 RepID=A0ACD0NXZ3_9BASI|nr:hypothetical protein IE53DRAFT_387006 [Violaceomyces palustris]
MIKGRKAFFHLGPLLVLVLLSFVKGHKKDRKYNARLRMGPSWDDILLRCNKTTSQIPIAYDQKDLASSAVTKDTAILYQCLPRDDPWVGENDVPAGESNWDCWCDEQDSDKAMERFKSLCSDLDGLLIG